MSLTVVSIPIGNPDDITLRALSTLKASDLIIGEERRELMPFLKSHGLEKKPVEFLNEHSRDSDLKDLVRHCREKHVSLVSDCGTPGFCDPGSDLVAACRSVGIRVAAAPGASSLMTLISLSGVRLKNFLFLGFLPAENLERKKALEDIKREKRAVILMDTPYRMSKLLNELSILIPKRSGVIGCDLTKPSEKIISGTVNQMLVELGETKKEFVLLLLP